MFNRYDSQTLFMLHRLASAKLSVSFSKIEDLDSVLELEAREGASTGSTLIRFLSNRARSRYRSVLSADSFARSRLSPCTQTRSLSWQAETNGIHCVTRHLPQIKLIANKTFALKSHREARLDSSGIPARTSCY